MGSEISFHLGGPEAVKGSFDVIAANLLPQELLSVGSFLSRRVAARGALIVSGFLRSQEKEIAEAFKREGFAVAASRRQKGWAAFLLQRKGEK